MSQRHYSIGNMDCANCAREVETGVSKLDGVNAVRVDFSSGILTLDGDIPFPVLKQRVEALGKTIHTDGDSAAALHKSARSGFLGFWDYLLSRHETRLAVAGGGIILASLLLSLLANLPEEAGAAAYTVGMLIALYPIARSGINTLRINHEFNINLLMSIAGIGAILIGEYLEAATVIFLFAIGEALEGFVTDRARDSLRSLMELKPTQAIRLDGNTEVVVHVDSLNVDDTILIKPGERIPMDGEVIAGVSSVNQAPITGESLPVIKQPRDTVFAGSINHEGALQVRVTHIAADNTLNRIIQMVQEAESVRSPSQRIIDRFAHYYTPGVVVLAALVALIPPLLFNAPFYSTTETTGWIYRALTLLVIACPCALVISTPVTIISAITSAARRGVLIKGGAYLESLGLVKAIAFDKTGTLTEGRPEVTIVHALTCIPGADFCPACDDLLALATAIERYATHPLAQAVTSAATARHVDNQYPAAEQVEVMAGRGVQGTVDGHLITISNRGHLNGGLSIPPDIQQMIEDAERAGQTTMLLHDNERLHGFIAAADTVRPASREVIAQLHNLGLSTILLTGDNQRAGKAVGQTVGVSDIRTELLPDDKVNAVHSIKQSYGHVAMVGDGINDTPALAAADVGIAMGGAGSAQAMETADIVLMSDDLSQLPYAIRLARFARRLIKHNVGLTFGMKLLFMLLALTGSATMWAAVFADVGMSLIVTMNGMRALRLK